MQNEEGLSSLSIHNLVYCSTAGHDMDKEALDQIIATAKHHNPRFGITGLLVYGSGIFFQWLEGPKENVIDLLKIISSDPRHSNVVVLAQEDEICERVFPSWDMELVDAADIQVVLEDAITQSSDPKHKTALSKMLQEVSASSIINPAS